MSTSVQGSVVIRRLRTGQTLLLALKSTGAELYQTVTADGKTVAPSWTADGTHPVIVPEGRSLATGQKAATLSDWTWSYLGNALSFDDNGACTTSGFEKTFKVVKATGQLEIIGNLASKNNMDNDTLTFRAKVTVGGVSAVLEKDIEVVIAQGGATSWWGNVSADNVVLTSDAETAKLTTTLFSGGSQVTDYTVDWYKSAVDAAHKMGVTGKEITVGRSDVDGTTLFIAVFKVGGQEQYTDGIMLTDMADEYKVVTANTGDIADTGDVTVTATLMDARKNAKADLAACKWSAWLYKVTDAAQGDGQINFTGGKLEATDISSRNTSTDAMVCAVKVSSADSGESDVAVLFEATFEV